MILDLIKSNASYDTVHGKPRVTEKRDNKFIVRLNIKEIIDEGTGSVVGYSCYETEIDDKPTADNIKRTIIRNVYPHSEAELINNYQMYKLGMSKDQSHEKKYIDYLRVLNELDEMLSEGNVF